MRYSDIRTRIQNSLADEQAVFLDATTTDLLILEGLETIAEATAAVRRTVFVPRLPGQIYFFANAIAPDLMYPTRLWNYANQRPLIATSLNELDDFLERWERTTGIAEFWFPVGWDFFGVWPGASAGGSILRVDYVAWPRRNITADGKPELPEATQEALVYYGRYAGLLRQRDVEGALAMWDLFLAELGLSNAHSGARRIQGMTNQRNQRGDSDEVFPAGIT